MRLLVSLRLIIMAGALLGADDLPVVDSRELPRFPPNEPESARATFVVRRGFHLELVAAEPLVTSPIAACFDEAGRLFVLEMRDYSEQRDARPHLGRVRVLEDLDSDGRCDRATVFADDLPWPTALIWARGGLFVCAAPDILWLQDTDGDGRADVRQVVFTGFNTGAAKMNVQALPNSFAWGPDNRLHLQTGGGNRGLIRSSKRPDSAPVELAGRDFWFDPRTFEFGFEAGGGQYGMSYDDRGRRFVCNNSDHLRTYIFDDRYAARNPFADLPSPLVSIAADGPAAEVFRISPDEPWRVVRTRWRVAGKVPGPVEGGGRVSGYFTGATGTTVYRGDAFGAEFADNTFTGDAGGNLVHRKQLRENGVSVLGQRPVDERTAEFIASRDTWFRPASFANAPDGTLYIIDMYREVIEHPWSIPEQIKVHLDLTSGRDRGRIWRIAPDGFKSRPAPALHRASSQDLVATLEHPNGWHRDTATRLLCERNDAATLPALTSLLAKSRSPRARLHSLRALDGLGALSEPVLLQALGDVDATIREHAVKLCEKFAPGEPAPESVWERLSALAQDPAPRVRLQIAYTVGSLKNPGAVALLAELAKRDADDAWISAAVRSAPPDHMAPLFRQLAADERFSASPSGERFLAQLATAVGARHDPEEVDAVFAFAAESVPRVGLLAALAEGLERAAQPLPAPARETRLQAAFSHARAMLGATQTSDLEQVAAVRLLGFDPSSNARDALLKRLASPTSEMMGRVLFDALDRKGDDAVVGSVLKQWKELTPSLRAEATRFLCARPARARALLEAIRSGIASAQEIPATETARLRQNRDPEISAAAAKLFPVPAAESRDAVLRRFEPALQLAGNAKEGRALYVERCASCHRFRGEGHVFGPDLESIANGGKAKILAHLIDPNREVAPQFAAYVAELVDGSTLSGVLATESSDAVVIREPLGRETLVPQSRVKRVQTTGRSPMPEGLETGLSQQQMANLLEFLTAATSR